ncbi:MAG: CZB domain-containing protein [Magnetococcales bacterium]|nr:CZB domain-containing protein [Magnetococcales bacterium]
MKTQLDIDFARMAHLNWEQELELMVKKASVPSKLESHKDCELGTWLHVTGIKKYKGNQAIRQLIDVHKTFHSVADRVSNDVNIYDQLSLRMDMKKIRGLSREIIFLLTTIELSSLEMQRRGNILTAPIKKLLRNLFESSTTTISDKNNILEIGHARLVHLQWSRNMLTAFEDWGNKIKLESAGKCSLGAWIDTIGLKRYESIPEIKLLEETHKAFHAKADDTIRALRKKNLKKSDLYYEQMLDYSTEVIYLLSVLELRLIDSDDIAPSAKVFG